MSEVELHDTDRPAPDAAATGGAARMIAIVVIALAVLAIVGTGGWLVGRHHPANALPAPSAVDIGFARDMSTHHTQAVTMAGYVRDHTSDGEIRLLAFDIETSQTSQVGQMQGWLDAWQQPRTTTADQMAWMNHPIPNGELMPGMVTPAQLDKLRSLTGRELDIDFLQLMIYHHQGGLQMAQYALDHASTQYVRDFASRVVAGQSAEVLQMETLLRQRGASPITPPPS